MTPCYGNRGQAFLPFDSPCLAARRDANVDRLTASLGEPEVGDQPPQPLGRAGQCLGPAARIAHGLRSGLDLFSHLACRIGVGFGDEPYWLHEIGQRVGPVSRRPR